jgi:hypothetical protein
MTEPIHTANKRDRVAARLMQGSAPGRARVAGKRFTRDYQPKGRGRPKGSRNVVTRNVREAILAACEAFGEKRGLEGYFISMARDHPAAICKMLVALLPKHPKVERNEAPPEYKSLAEVREGLAQRGINFDTAFQLQHYKGPLVELVGDDVTDHPDRDAESG